MRINAYLARAGVASRRKADELIKSGRVTVNDEPALLNTVVAPGDKVKVDEKEVTGQALLYIVLHKPAGVVTTAKDTHGRPIVTELISITERVVPVGRLDQDTTGVLLLTNDGGLANKLMHPRHKVKKVYVATVAGEITAEKLQSLESGIELEEGKTSPAVAKKLKENQVELTIHEGRKHQVKRMLAAVGLKVNQLHRTNYAGIEAANLAPGEWRELTTQEIKRLKMIQ